MLGFHGVCSRQFPFVCPFEPYYNRRGSIYSIAESRRVPAVNYSNLAHGLFKVIAIIAQIMQIATTQPAWATQPRTDEAYRFSDSFLGCSEAVTRFRFGFLGTGDPFRVRVLWFLETRDFLEEVGVEEPSWRTSPMILMKMVMMMMMMKTTMMMMMMMMGTTMCRPVSVASGGELLKKE